MQTRIDFVLLFSLRTISLAADVTVYDYNDYFYGELQNLKPVAESWFPWKFSFDSRFWMYIRLKNTSTSVTAINITYNTDFRIEEIEKFTKEYSQIKDEEFYKDFCGGSIFSGIEMEIKLNLYTSNILHLSLPVAKGRAVASITNELLEKEFPYYDSNVRYGFVLVIYLINIRDGPPLATDTKMDTTTVNADTDVQTIKPNNTFTSNSSTNLEITTHKNSAIDTKNTKQESSQNVVLIYVIPSVIGMCGIMFVIYLISVKKYCHRNSNPVEETIELNTYTTANEVVYADFGFEHGDSQPPKRDEESPYAQIIGVLKPVDGNVNNK